MQRHPIRDILTTMFMPWTIKNRYTRIWAYCNFATVAVAIAGFFTEALATPLLILICLQTLALLISQIKFFREMRTTSRNIKNYKLVLAAIEGKIDVSELPPELQEDLKIAFATNRLKDNLS